MAENEIDAGVLEELLQALLEVAARKDALRSWPREAAPESYPPVQARRDDDGTLGVFRFFTIVEVTGSMALDPVRDMTVEQARAKIEGVDKLKPGDEVGVELPLGRLAAIALADVEAVRAGRVHLLPARVVEMLGDPALAGAISARLSALRGPPPHVPLRRLVTDFGGDAVEWTAVCGDVEDPSDLAARREDEAGDDEGEGAVERSPRGELVVLVERGDEHKLVVVPTAPSAAGHAALLRALAPLPDDQSLWRFLEVEGPALLCGAEGSLWSHDPGASSPSAGSEPPAPVRKLSLEVKSIAIARDPTVYGVARAKARLLTWSGDKIVDEREATVGLPVDLPRFVDQAWPEGEALERVQAAAQQFRADLRRRMSALAQASAPVSDPATGDDVLNPRQPTVDDVLGGAAFLRVVARAAEGVLELPEPGAEPLELREVEGGPEDEIGLRIADLGVLVLSPADNVVKLRAGEEDRELYVDGGILDGDAHAWRACAAVLAQAVVDADVDIELAFPAEGSDPGSDDVETMMLSEWLLSLADEDEPLSWPPRAGAAESVTALHVVIDRFVDPGPHFAAQGAAGPADRSAR